MPPIPGLRVVISGIHGYGVIAARDFAPGELVADVEGIAWNAGTEDLDDRYSLWLVDDWYFDMVDQTRWINHSCAPNCEIEGDVAKDGKSPWARVVAVRAIRAGEEVTYDYAFDAELAEPCSCGAATCRGWIVDEDQLAELRQRRGA